MVLDRASPLSWCGFSTLLSHSSCPGHSFESGEKGTGVSRFLSPFTVNCRDTDNYRNGACFLNRGPEELGGMPALLCGPTPEG